MRFARFVFGNCAASSPKSPPAQTHGDIQDRALLRLHELGVEPSGAARKCVGRKFVLVA